MTFVNVISIIIVIFVSLTNNKKSATVTLNGPKMHVPVKNRIDLNCSVEGATNLEDQIVFFKGTSTNPFGFLIQRGSSCQTGKAPEKHYLLFCAGGTFVASTSIKNYTLVISSVSENDATRWYCLLNISNIRSNDYTVVLQNGSNDDKTGTASVISTTLCLLVSLIGIVGVAYCI